MSILSIGVGQGGVSMVKSICEDNGMECPFLVDSEPKAIGSSQKKIFSDRNVVFDSSGRGSNWALGYSNTFSEKNKDNLLAISYEKMRKYWESFDFTKGSELFFSLYGGTGSGLASHMIELLKEEFPRLPIDCHVIKGFSTDKTALTEYNTVLSLSSVMENVRTVRVIDNQAILDHFTLKGFEAVQMKDINKYYADIYSNLGKTSEFNYISDNKIQNSFKINYNCLKGGFPVRELNRICSEKCQALHFSLTGLEPKREDIAAITVQAQKRTKFATQTVKFNSSKRTKVIFASKDTKFKLFTVETCNKAWLKYSEKAYFHWLERFGVDEAMFLERFLSLQSSIDSGLLG